MLGLAPAPAAAPNDDGEQLSISHEPLIDDQTRQFIVNSLDYSSIAATGLESWFPINVVLRGQHGDILGGALGGVWGGWLQVDQLWVAAPVRGRGYGRRLLEAAEAHARRRGAVGVTLDTHSFQARPFYEKLGYEVFGVIDGYPPGQQKFFLKKLLASTPAEAISS